jgi:hypothetical protein
MQERSEPSCHARGADVVGDVARKRLRRQTKRAVVRRQRVGSVIAKQENAGAAWPVDDLDGLS